MASSDALPIPRKNTAYRVAFAGLKSDGTLITSGTGMDSEVSKDQGTFADCTNEAAEIASSSGVYYLDLTSTEMNADMVIVKCTWTNTGALPTVLVLYPQEADDIRVNPTYWNGGAIPAPNQTGVPTTDVAYWKGAAAAAVDTNGYPKVTLKGGTGAGEVDLSSGQVKVSANNDKTGYGLADGAITAAKIASDAITAAKIAMGAIDADALAADAAAEIAAAVVDQTLSGHTGVGTVGSKLGMLGAGVVTFAAPVNAQTSDLEIVRGDDYTASSGRALPEWSSEDWTPLDLSNAASVTLRARARYSGAVFTKAASVLSDTQVRVEFTAAETAEFAVGREAYSFDLQAVLAAGDVVTLVQGKIHVKFDVQ